MAQTRKEGPTATSTPTLSLPSKLNAQIDLLVSLHLWSWPALTLAIHNGWGGDRQVSSDKRDWLAGAVSELLTSNPPQISDVDDLEEVLLQVMLDEFEIIVDDGSTEEMASKIWGNAEKLQKGDIVELQEMYTKWQEKQAKGGEKVVGIVRGEDKDADDTDWDDEDDSKDELDEFSDGDAEMKDARPTEARTEQKAEPEIDEDGFTKVVSKRKR